MDVATTEKCYSERKEVVIIGTYQTIGDSNPERLVLLVGNGPSAIVLSYLLCGHVPYWNGCPVSNDYLNMKLEEHVKDVSLLEQVRSRE